MENKTKEELAELVRAQVAVIDGLTLELATRQPAAPAAPVVTVDTPEFGALLTRLNMCAGQKEIDRTRSDIIRSADAHTARAVAAERERAARLAVQWGNARVPEGGGNALRNFAEALSGGTEPVQQPAAVVGQEPIGYVVTHDPSGGDFSTGKAGYKNMKVTYGDRCKLVYTAPVPAAGVHDAQEQIHIGTRLRRVAKAAGVTVDYGDDAFYYAGAFSILGDIARTLEKTAAGVQGAKFDISTPDRIRLFDLDGMLLNYRCAATDAKRDEFKAAIVAAFSALADHSQPDSGRDAGLVRALRGILDIHRPMTGNPSDAELIEHWEYEKSAGNGAADANLFALRTLAAHPAPSSDAALPTDISTKLREYASNPGYSHNDYADVMRTAADECERFYGGMVAWKETAQAKDRSWSKHVEEIVEKRLAAHPANGAQAEDINFALLSKEEMQTIENQFNWHNARSCGTHIRFAYAVARAILAAAKKGG